MKAESPSPEETPRTVEPSLQESDYPHEDIHQTEMFTPFLRRKRTWLVFFSLVMLFVIARWMPQPYLAEMEKGLDATKITLGLGILACIAFLWLTEALPLAATALLVPLLSSLAGISDIKTALLPFADPLIFMFFGGFALASALSYQKVDLWIARKLILLGRGQFIPVALLLFGCTAFLSMWMSNTATTAMMLPIALGVIHRTGGTPSHNKNALFLLLGIAYSSSIGGLGTIIGSPPNGIAAAKLQINFTQWMAFGIPCVLLLLPCMAFILYKVCKPDKTLTIVEEEKSFVFNWHRTATLLIFGATALCWICGSWIAKSLGITVAIDTIIALTSVFLLLYFRVVRWRDIDNGTDWSVLLLFGGGLSLSELLNRTGASTFLARLLSSNIDGAPVILILAAAVAFAIISGELASNTASAALLVPIFYSVSGELGLSAASLVIPIALACSCSFMLPVGTPPNAIVFGTRLVPQMAMVKNGLLLNFACLIIIVLLSYLIL
jgi:sodium-dependent dicarboxylate transporter 2/3/5